MATKKTTARKSSRPLATKPAAPAAAAVTVSASTPVTRPAATATATPLAASTKAKAARLTNDKDKSGKAHGAGKGSKKKAKPKGEKKQEEASPKKMVRDSFTMPSGDYALIGSLKTQALAVGVPVKKSELLRAGLITLSRMPSAQLTELLTSMPKIKTGRPGKKKK